MRGPGNEVEREGGPSYLRWLSFISTCFPKRPHKEYPIGITIQINIKSIFALFMFFLSIGNVLFHCASVIKQNNINPFLYINELTPSQKHPPVRQTYTHLLDRHTPTCFTKLRWQLQCNLTKLILLRDLRKNSNFDRSQLRMQVQNCAEFYITTGVRSLLLLICIHQKSQES